jgi:hypothetical protein
MVAVGCWSSCSDHEGEQHHLRYLGQSWARVRERHVRGVVGATAVSLPRIFGYLLLIPLTPPITTSTKEESMNLREKKTE